MSENLNKVIKSLVNSNDNERRVHVREKCINATLSEETTNLLIAQGALEASIDTSKYGFTNGNSDIQGKSNKKILAGTPLSEQWDD